MPKAEFLKYRYSAALYHTVIDETYRMTFVGAYLSSKHAQIQLMRRMDRWLFYHNFPASV